MAFSGTDPNDITPKTGENEDPGAARPHDADTVGAALSSGALGAAGDTFRRSYHQELAAGTQRFLNSIAGHSIDELKGIKDALVVRMHGRLLDLAREGFGLIVQDGACPGAITNALTRMNGAGQYLRGGVTVVSADARLVFGDSGNEKTSFHSIATGERMKFLTGALREINDLPGTTILGVNGSVESGRVTVYISDREQQGTIGQFYFAPIPRHDSIRSWRGGQISAAIAGLHFLEGWLDRVGPNERIVHIHSAELLLLDRPRASEEHERAIRSIKDMNDRHFRHLRDVVRNGDHSGFIFGESFTGGAINSLFQSVPRMARYVDYAVVWYHERFKEVFGVDRSYLHTQRIASPGTVREAAFGLLDNPPSILPASSKRGIIGTRDSHTAVTTSGWASLDAPGVADNFSVCVRSLWGGQVRTYTAQLDVESSRVLPPSYARKEITKQLGVATALYLIGRVLGDLDPTVSASFKRSNEGLRRFIHSQAGGPLKIICESN
jgi:nicotinamide mononucleotide (NMN) deamidase PncC